MPPEASSYTAHYEALRTRMIAADARAGMPDHHVRGVALAVLLQNGLPAWLAAVEPILSRRPAITEAIRAAVTPPVLDARRSLPALAPEVLPVAQHAEVMQLLVALVLSAARSTHRDPATARMRAGASR